MNGVFAIGSVALMVALVLTLLNARDRRRDRAAAVVLRACATPSLRGLIALRVRAPLLSRRTVAFLDMPACAAADAWPTMQRLADVLPPNVGLVIETRLERRLDVSLPAGHPATRPYHQRGLGSAPSSRYAIFIRVR